mgnify:CR=1 FL=1
MFAGNQYDTAVPIYLQIIERIEQKLVTGEWRAGERVPTVRELAAEFGVNPNTMQRALAELEARGLLETQRTAGRTVTGDVEKIAQTRRALAQTLVHHFYHQAAALGLTKAEIAALLEQEEA